MCHCRVNLYKDGSYYLPGTKGAKPEGLLVLHRLIYGNVKKISIKTISLSLDICPLYRLFKLSFWDKKWPELT